MKKQALILTILSVFGCACTKELDHNISEQGSATLRLNLSIEETKTTVSSPDESGKRTVLWKVGDKIALNGVESNGLDQQYDGKKSAEFTFEGVFDAPYKLLYPSSMYVDESHILLPAVQEAMPGDDDFASGAVPMAGYVEALPAGISMKQLCAAVKIQWKQSAANPDPDDILYVEFKGGNGEQVSGKFAIDYSAATLTGNDNGKAAKVVRANSGKPQSSSTCVTNIVIPAGIYEKGFTIRIVDVNGHYMEKSVTSSRTFEAGTVASFPVIEFEPTGTVLVIDTKAKLLAWGAGSEFKDSSSEVVLAADIDMKDENWTAFDFAGKFDGMGHSITNLVVSTEGDANFITDLTGSVSNVTFGSSSDTTVFTSAKSATGTFYVAPIRYASGTATIDNVSNYAKLSFTGTSTATLYCAGIVGYFSSSAAVSNCSFYGSVTIESPLSTASNIGGIMGNLAGKGTVKDCINYGSLNVKQTFAQSLNFGGVVGYCPAAGTIDGCINEGSVIMSATATPSSGQFSMGGVLGYNNTVACTVKGCINRGTVYKSGAEAKRPNYIGGIIGYTNQATLITDCVNEATGVVKNTATCSSQQLYIGGILGYASLNPTIKSCRNEGTVTNSSAATNIMLGGIVGKIAGEAKVGGAGTPCVNSGTVSNTGASSNASANIIPNITIAGIVGLVTKASVTCCSNTGTVSNTGTLYTGKKDGAYLQAGNLVVVGGIAGTVNGAATITNCETQAKLSNSSKTVPCRYCTGGIVGYAYFASMASFKDNTAGGTITVSGSAAFENNAGGIIGYINGIAGTISNCTNAAPLTSSATRVLTDTLSDRSTAKAMCFGGIVGKSTGALSLSSCINNAKIYNNKGKTTLAGLNLAGILGYCGAESTVSACTNNGELMDLTSSSVENGNTGQYYNIGGIVGCADAKLTINGKCANTGMITKSTGTGSSKHYYHIGGILGYNTVDDSAIDDCSNSAAVKQSASNNKGSSYSGGILGRTVKKMSVTNCTNSGEISSNSVSAYMYFGGVVGAFSSGASGAMLSSCENTGAVIQKAKISTCVRMGGVIGDAFGAYTFSNLVNRGALSNASESVTEVRIGGIEASSTNSTLALDKCVNYGNITNSTTGTLATGIFGGVLGYKSDTKCSLTDCENYGNISVDATVAITSLYLSGGVAQSTKPSSLSGGQINCEISSAKVAKTSYIGQILGCGNSTTATNVGFAGSCNGTVIDETNWNQTNPALAYGAIVTTTENFNLSGDENSCYLIPDASKAGIDDVSQKTDDKQW